MSTVDTRCYFDRNDKKIVLIKTRDGKQFIKRGNRWPRINTTKYSLIEPNKIMKRKDTIKEYWQNFFEDLVLNANADIISEFEEVCWTYNFNPLDNYERTSFFIQYYENWIEWRKIKLMNGLIAVYKGSWIDGQLTTNVFVKKCVDKDTSLIYYREEEEKKHKEGFELYKSYAHG